MKIENGKKYKFNTIDSELQMRNGTIVEIIRPLTEDECDIDDVGNMYKARFEDGYERDVFEDELSPDVEGLKTKLIEALLSTLTYDDMTPEQMALVVEYETELWKPKVDALRLGSDFNEDEIKEFIHDWWLDYKIADGTEDNLLDYVG